MLARPHHLRLNNLMKAQDIRVGWRIISVLLGSLVVIQGCFTLVSLIFHTPMAGMNVVVFLLCLWLCWGTYQGQLPARLMLTVLLVLNGLVNFLGGALAISFGLIELLFAACLTFLGPVNRYFEYASQQ